MLAFLEKICTQLENQAIDYMLSGSLALNAYTVPRMTRDIDIVIALDANNLARFLALFSEEQSYYSLPAIQQAIDSSGMFNVIDFETGYKLDFIVLKAAPFRKTEFQRRRRSQALGFPVWLVSIEDLILSKLIWIQELDSDRQKEDLQHLLAVPEIDLSYIQNWVHTLQLKTFGLFHA